LSISSSVTEPSARTSMSALLPRVNLASRLPPPAPALDLSPCAEGAPFIRARANANETSLGDYRGTTTERTLRGRIRYEEGGRWTTPRGRRLGKRDSTPGTKAKQTRTMKELLDAQKRSRKRENPRRSGQKSKVALT
jgi:hypothetical protein